MQEVLNFGDYSTPHQAVVAESNDRHHTAGQGQGTLNKEDGMAQHSNTPSTASAVSTSVSSSRRQLMSRAAVTHKFRKLKTPSKCRECDSYVYFQGEFRQSLWERRHIYDFAQFLTICISISTNYIS